MAVQKPSPVVPKGLVLMLPVHAWGPAEHERADLPKWERVPWFLNDVAGWVLICAESDNLKAEIQWACPPGTKWRRPRRGTRPTSAFYYWDSAWFGLRKGSTPAEARKAVLAGLRQIQGRLSSRHWLDWSYAYSLVARIDWLKLIRDHQKGE